MENYRQTIQINRQLPEVLNAFTKNIPLWWSESFEGNAENPGDRFTVRFGNAVFKTIRVQHPESPKQVLWHVEDSLIDFEELNNKREWINTRILWETEPDEEGVKIHLTHFGLHPEQDCYQICAAGWQQFTGSLKQFLETGKGNPFLK